jgi:lambda family phage portal protein
VKPISEYVRRFESAFQVLRGRETETRGAYAGAVFSRLNSDWITAALPSDQELVTDLRTLRTRSRSLGRDNPFGVRFLELIQENVIGPTGIDAQPFVADEGGEQFKALNRMLHDKWLDFSEHAGLDGSHLTDFCLTGSSCLGQDGEIFTRFVRGRDLPYGLALQAIDPDLVDESYNMARDRNRGMNEVRLSIEVDERGRRVAYRFYEESPVFGSRGTNPYWVQAPDVLHVGRARRLNQTRFVPWFHPVIDAMRMLDGLVEAELVASRTAAAKMGFLINKSGGAIGAKNASGGRDPVPMEAAPGSMPVLPKDWEFQGWDPQHPTTAFATFHASMIRRIAAGLGISYTSLANDPGDANYSSSRSALQMEQRFWRKIQQMWVRKFMQPIYDEWLRMSILTGDLDLGRLEFASLRRVKWEVPGWDWIDPKADVEAAILAIENHLDSPQRIVGARGLDFEEDVVAPQKAARQMLEAAGLSTPASDGGAASETDTPTNRTSDGSGQPTSSATRKPSKNGAAAREPVTT